MSFSNIAHVVNVMNPEEDCEQVSAQLCINYIRYKSKNIGHKFISIIRSFLDRRKIDLEFFFASEVDHVGTLKSIFWVDGSKVFLFKFF